MTETRERIERTTPIVDLVEEDVHDAATKVASFTPELLDSLAAGATPDDLIVDLAGALDANEPETIQLNTVLLEAPPPELSLERATLELYIESPDVDGPLAALELELEHVPRAWKVAAVLVASATLLGIAVALGRLVAI